jgi:HD superfamily phosphohydrolase
LNKKKIFNDPVYGFISVPYEIVFDLIEHPYFQRLRNIKQLGLTHLVYPGALHTRFHHALGAMHLMGIAIESLRYKDIEITEEEAEAATIAILLHDIGHGPFSHALESCIVPDVHHEALSILFMEELNKQFKGRLTLAIEIFEDKYHKKFLHQLVSGQLDMDRMDYLNRDSFYTGVSEGVIGFDRILKMISVKDDKLVIEEKGIYSVEKFLIARRLMYWQVYFHKTVLSAEQLLYKILKRAKQISLQGAELFATPHFSTFLKQNLKIVDFRSNEKYLQAFSALDDHDIYSAIKVWCNHVDPVLARLCSDLVTRNLYSIELSNVEVDPYYLNLKKQECAERFNLSNEEVDYFVFEGIINNNAYNPEIGNIYILTKNHVLQDVALASDGLNVEALTRNVKKYFLCYPKY